MKIPLCQLTLLDWGFRHYSFLNCHDQSGRLARPGKSGIQASAFYQ
jgi:hypothetical protein